MSELRTILAKLSALTKAELEEVRREIALLKSVASDRGISVTTTDAEECLATIVNQMMPFEHTSIAKLREDSGYSAFVLRVPEVFSYLGGKRTSLNEKRSLLHIGVTLLREDLSGMQITVTSRVLMNHMHRLPAVMNKSFPGYLPLMAVRSTSVSKW